MAVKKRRIVQWTAPITYALSSSADTDEDWITKGIDLFNKAVAGGGGPAAVFVPVTGGAGAQVRFVAGSSGESPIGRVDTSPGAPPQAVNFHRNDPLVGQYATLWHEMGHCLGLGHEQFHTQYPLRPQLAQILTGDLTTREENTNKGLTGTVYEDLGAFDNKSIMLYQLTSMLDDGRVEETSAVAQPTVFGTAPATSGRPRGGSNPAKPVAATTTVTLLTPRIQVPTGYVVKPGRLSPADIVAIVQLTR